MFWKTDQVVTFNILRYTNLNFGFRLELNMPVYFSNRIIGCKFGENDAGIAGFPQAQQKNYEEIK